MTTIYSLIIYLFIHLLIFLKNFIKGDKEFYERWKNSNQSYIDYYKTPLYDLKAM